MRNVSRLRHWQRLFHTVRHLKPIQIVNRGWRKFYTPAVDHRPAPSLRELEKKWASSVVKDGHLVHPWKFSFLGVSRECRFPDDWNDPAIEKLWLYNLHYFDDLQSNHSEQQEHWLYRLLELWVADNPPVEGTGWEPYPSSLRMVNWIKWILTGHAVPKEAIQSLAVQSRVLEKRLEYHLLGNHLLANAKALVFSGLFFSGPEADNWLRKGMRMLEAQLDEQILADGGHFERSPMYHAIIFEDVLDCINLLGSYGVVVPRFLYGKVQPMALWLRGMSHPDGRVALVNDTAWGIAADPEELLDYAGRLGIEMGSPTLSALVHLRESGYLRWQSKDLCAFFDVGDIGPDYLPGHAHADTLSFELSLFGYRFVVDSGVSCYGESEERLRQRRTAAHNTVVVDGHDSSEVWAGFRVARRARPVGLRIAEEFDKLSVSCGHNGFRRLPGNVMHTREWEMSPHRMVIIDYLTGDFSEAFSRLHFHPDVRIDPAGEFAFCALTADGKSVFVEVEGGVAHLIDTTYHPRFGSTLSNRCLHVVFSQDRCRVTLNWS
jgi:uncharacterized heparinase superfamily protein